MNCIITYDNHKQHIQVLYKIVNWLTPIKPRRNHDQISRLKYLQDQLAKKINSVLNKGDTTVHYWMFDDIIPLLINQANWNKQVQRGWKEVYTELISFLKSGGRMDVNYSTRVIAIVDKRKLYHHYGSIWLRKDVNNVVLEDDDGCCQTELGDFEILLRIAIEASKALEVEANTFRVQPEGNNNTCKGYPHPHIADDGHMCFGDHEAFVTGLLSQGLFDAAFDSVESIVNTYNEDSPYVPLSQWGASCAECGNSGADYFCDRCGAEICESCERYSEVNDCSLCPQCVSICVECNTVIKRDSSKDQACEGCSGTLCPRCFDKLGGFCDSCGEECNCGNRANKGDIFQCSECGDCICNDCSEYHKGQDLCRDCYETLTNEDTNETEVITQSVPQVDVVEPIH